MKLPRTGAGAAAAKCAAQRNDLVILTRSLLAQLDDVLRPAAKRPKLVAGAWWPRETVTAEEAARAWLAMEGFDA